MIRKFFSAMILCCAVVSLSSCAEVSVPDARHVDIPNPVGAEKRRQAVNERPDSVIYLPLGEDVLVPARISGDVLPTDKVGPFELRGETLAGALQLILADYDISIAFESEEGLSRKVTVANLKGGLDKVVQRVCSLADMYCSYEDGAIVVKDTQTFTVTLPPLAGADGSGSFIEDTISGLSAVLGDGASPASDATTRTIIYSATQRTAGLAENYFQRLRANTAMIVFETYIWEVSLNSGNSTGIDWEAAETFGKFKSGINIVGSVGAQFTNPVSIGLPQTLGTTPADVIDFLSQFGAVKTISQPQITMLSGAQAELRVADTQNYVSEISSTISGDQTTTSVSTASVDSGFELSIGSSWDKSTIYANVNINLSNVDQIDDFVFSDGGTGGSSTTIQLPQTTERELTTQIRTRPGDSVLIGGLVRERDNFDSSGPGFMEPVFPSSRTAQTENLELVILMRPRVVVYTSEKDGGYKEKSAPPVEVSRAREEWLKDNTQQVQPVPAAPVVSQTIATEPVALKAEVASTHTFELPPASEMPVVKSQAPVVPPTPAYKGVAVGDSPLKLHRSPVNRPAPYTNPSAAVNIYSSPTPQIVTPQVETPLAPGVYANAKPLNVYKAYERSQNSFYGE